MNHKEQIDPTTSLKGLFAAKNIPKGTVVFRETPVASVVVGDTRQKALVKKLSLKKSDDLITYLLTKDILSNKTIQRETLGKILQEYPINKLPEEDVDLREKEAALIEELRSDFNWIDAVGLYWIVKEHKTSYLNNYRETSVRLPDGRTQNQTFAHPHDLGWGFYFSCAYLRRTDDPHKFNCEYALRRGNMVSIESTRDIKTGEQLFTC